MQQNVMCFGERLHEAQVEDYDELNEEALKFVELYRVLAGGFFLAIS